MSSDIVIGTIQMLPIAEAKPKIGGTYFIAVRAATRLYGSSKRGNRRIGCATRQDHDYWFTGRGRLKHADITDVSKYRVDDRRFTKLFGAVHPR